MTTRIGTMTTRMLRCHAGGKGRPSQCQKLTTARCVACGRPFCGHHSKAIAPELGGLPHAQDIHEHAANLARGFKVLCSRCRGSWETHTATDKQVHVGRLADCPTCKGQ